MFGSYSIPVEYKGRNNYIPAQDNAVKQGVVVVGKEVVLGSGRHRRCRGCMSAREVASCRRKDDRQQSSIASDWIMTATTIEALFEQLHITRNSIIYIYRYLFVSTRDEGKTGWTKLLYVCGAESVTRIS